MLFLPCCFPAAYIHTPKCALCKKACSFVVYQRRNYYVVIFSSLPLYECECVCMGVCVACFFLSVLFLFEHALHSTPPPNHSSANERERVVRQAMAAKNYLLLLFLLVFGFRFCFSVVVVVVIV